MSGNLEVVITVDWLDELGVDFIFIDIDGCYIPFRIAEERTKNSGRLLKLDNIDTKEEAEHIKELAEGLANKLPHIDVFEAEQEIRSFVLRYDGIRYTYQKMEKFRKKAIEALSNFPDNKYKENLLALLDYAINRMK